MMELREKIARAICGNWIVGDDRPWQQWVEEADAVIEVLAQHTAHAESLRDALKKANDQVERFEREWYLRGDEIERLRVELETESIRLAACGVVALSNTPESAKKARDMLPKYRSASCDDVARMVDENMRLRAAVQANHEWHERTDDYGGYPESEICEINTAALALTTKTEGNP